MSISIKEARAYLDMSEIYQAVYGTKNGIDLYTHGELIERIEQIKETASVKFYDEQGRRSL